MTAAPATTATRAPEPDPRIRFASVEHHITYLRAPLNWRVRIWGQSVGGYGVLDGSVSRYADRDRAELVADIWIATGITPAFQTDEVRDRFLAEHGAAANVRVPADVGAVL